MQEPERARAVALVQPSGHVRGAVGARPAVQARPVERRSPAAVAAGYALWSLLWALVVLWAAFLWHPWIDWFGRAR